MPPRTTDPTDEIPEDFLEDVDDQDTPDEGEQDDLQDGDEGTRPEDAEVEKDETRDEVRRGRDERSERAPRESSAVRMQRLAQEARRDADETRRELADLRAEMQRSRQAAQESPEQEAARLALMEPEQRATYTINRALERQQQVFAHMQAQNQDVLDKATFSSLCATTKYFAAVKDEVEKKLVDLRRRGQNVDREALAKYVLGERLLARGPKVAERQRQNGQRNIQRQSVRPREGRSDQTSPSGEDRRRAQRLARLEDVTF